MNPLIINIIPHSPADHYALNEGPDSYWEKDDGQCVGFGTRKWPNLLGEAIVKVTDHDCSCGMGAIGFLEPLRRAYGGMRTLGFLVDPQRVEK